MKRRSFIKAMLAAPAAMAGVAWGAGEVASTEMASSVAIPHGYNWVTLHVTRTDTLEAISYTFRPHEVFHVPEDCNFVDAKLSVDLYGCNKCTVIGSQCLTPPAH